MKQPKTSKRSSSANVHAAQRSLAALLYEGGARAQATGTLTAVPLDKVVENGAHARRTWDKADLEALARSMRENGLLEPILVKTRPKGHYELIAGSRRVRAAKILGWDTVDAIVRDDVTEAGVLSASAVENLQRANLTPYEEARAYQALIDKGLTQDQVAQACGVGITTVKNRLNLLKLPEAIAKRAGDPGFSEAHLAALNAYAGVEGALEKLAPILGTKHKWRGEILTVSDFRDEAKRVLKSSGKLISPSDWKLHELKQRSSKLRSALAKAPTIKGERGYDDVKVVTPEVRAALKDARAKAAKEREEETKGNTGARKVDHEFENAVREGGQRLRKERIPKVVKARVDLGPKEIGLLAATFLNGYDPDDVDVYAQASGFNVDELKNALGTRGGSGFDTWLEKAVRKDHMGVARLLLAHALIQGCEDYYGADTTTTDAWIGKTRKEAEAEARKILRAEQKATAKNETTVRDAGAKTTGGTCEVCGCTEDNACETTDGACAWVNPEKTRCSAAACVDGVNAAGKRVAAALTGKALQRADLVGAIGGADDEEQEVEA